jgi:hypothetical protein
MIKDQFLPQIQNGQKVDFELLKLPRAVLRREQLQFKVKNLNFDLESD